MKNRKEKIMSEVDRKLRQKQTAEVFTPEALVNQILAKFPETVWGKEKTFLDQSCGDGSFLVQILRIKLSKGHDSLQSLQSIYGVDIMQDNILECRVRLLKIINPEDITEEHIKAV